MKSSGWRPDGSQTGAAAVSVSTLRWASALLKKVPFKDVRTCPFVFLLVVDEFYHTRPNPEVLHLGRNPPVIDGCLFFSTPLLKHEPWQIWRPPFSTLSLIWNKVRQAANAHSLHCVLDWHVNSEGTMQTQHTWPPLDVKISQLVSFSHRLCSVSFTLQRTSSGDRASSFSLTMPYPGHPAAPGFQRRRAGSWCLFELCVKYRYGKSPRGETHKALTVSYSVLVPITHLRGLFSCQLPRLNSQLHDFKKSLSRAGVDWQPKLPLWLCLSAKHARPSFLLKKVAKKK